MLETAAVVDVGEPPSGSGTQASRANALAPAVFPAVRVNYKIRLDLYYKV
eukprot:COSAG06_NODE_61539_length_267_cov_0.910714_1_plen_50_part_01